MAAQERGISPLAALRHYIAQQALVARTILSSYHRCLSNRGMAEQDRFYLARLNAKAADLDLLVSPAQELQYPVSTPPGQVARAIHPRARRSIGICREALGA